MQDVSFALLLAIFGIHSRYKVDNVDGQTKSKRWVINGRASRISRDSKKLFGKRVGVAGEGLPHVRVAS